MEGGDGVCKGEVRKNIRENKGGGGGEEGWEQMVSGGGTLMRGREKGGRWRMERRE